MNSFRPSPLSRTLALVPPTVLLVAQHASAFDAFIKIGDIKGEAMEAKHTEWIELDSVQWSVGRAISSGGSIGGQREASNPSISELTISKRLDKATPALFLNAVGGSVPISTVTLELVNPSNSAVFYRITLNDVLVSSQSQQGASGDESVGETVSLNFTKIKIEYFMVNSKTGATEAVPAVGFDLAKGTTF